MLNKRKFGILTAVVLLLALILVLLGLPLMVLIIPLMKLTPILYRWRMRSRVYRWYKQLRTIEADLRREVDAERRRRFCHQTCELHENRDARRSVEAVPSCEIHRPSQLPLVSVHLRPVVRDQAARIHQ